MRDPIKKSKVLDLYSKGVSCNEIAIVLNIKRKAVSYYLKKSGVVLILKKNKPSLPLDKQKLICEEYPKLNSVQLGKKYGVSYSTIIKILKRNNIQINKSGNLKHKQDFCVTTYHLRQAKNAAKLRNIEFNLSLEFIAKLYEKQNGKCIYSGIPLTVRKFYEDNSANASLDRIDSKQGYLQNNIQWVDKNINMMKGSLSNENFIKFCKLVSQNKTS